MSTTTPTTNPATLTTNPKRTRLRPTSQTPTINKKADTTLTSTRSSQVWHKTTKQQNTSQSLGLGGQHTGSNRGSTSKAQHPGKRQTGCQTPRRPLDEAHCKVEPIDIDQTERVPETRTTNQKMGRRHRFLRTTNKSLQRTRRTNKRHDLARCSTNYFAWHSMESDFVISKHFQQTAHTTNRQKQWDTTKSTREAHDDEDNDDTLVLLSQII